MTFHGFTPTTLTWFEGLLADNSKAYFTAHRAEYEGAVAGPLEAMLAELAEEFGGTPRLFRPNRDVRFSPDKSPYKTNASGVLTDQPGAGALYVQVSADGLLAATGYHIMAADQLARYRAALCDNDGATSRGEALAAILHGLTGAGLGIGGERLKTLPRGIPRNAPNQDLLRWKSLTASESQLPAKAMAGRDALTHTARVWRTSAALLQWLDAYVGGSEHPAARP